MGVCYHKDASPPNEPAKFKFQQTHRVVYESLAEESNPKVSHGNLGLKLGHRMWNTTASMAA
eukprot:4291948-Alexandrium_andersonii.AAC.1